MDDFSSSSEKESSGGKGDLISASLLASKAGSTYKLPRLFLEAGASEIFGVLRLGEGLSSGADMKNDVCPSVALCSSAS